MPGREVCVADQDIYLNEIKRIGQSHFTLEEKKPFDIVTHKELFKDFVRPEITMRQSSTVMFIEELGIDFKTTHLLEVDDFDYPRKDVKDFGYPLIELEDVVLRTGSSFTDRQPALRPPDFF